MDVLVLFRAVTGEIGGWLVDETIESLPYHLNNGYQGMALEDADVFSVPAADIYRPDKYRVDIATRRLTLR